jgi:hypothetical protein
MDETSELMGVVRKVALARNNFQCRLVESGAETSTFLPFLERVLQEGVVITIQIENHRIRVQFNLNPHRSVRPTPEPSAPPTNCPIRTVGPSGLGHTSSRTVPQASELNLVTVLQETLIALVYDGGKTGLIPVISRFGTSLLATIPTVVFTPQVF